MLRSFELNNTTNNSLDVRIKVTIRRWIGFSVVSFKIVSPFRLNDDHDVMYFSFVAIYLMMIVGQCNQHQNTRHENSHDSTIKKDFTVLMFYSKEIDKTDGNFIAETYSLRRFKKNAFHPNTPYQVDSGLPKKLNSSIVSKKYTLF